MSHNGSSETSSFLDENWTAWFCGLSGNHFFCEVEKSYIEDTFNLFGLKHFLPKDYSKALDTILDRLTPMEPESEELSRSAALLYGLIHARYIITSHGLDAMHRKFMNREFGECPRALCRGQPVVPMGFTDDPKHGVVKLFCPKCRDVYNCNASQRHIDGAFFGPTFPHIFFMSFDDCVPDSAMESYVPRVFGFRVHPSSTSIPRCLPHASRGNGTLDGRLHFHAGRVGLGALSEASTGAGTGYEKSGGGDSVTTGRLGRLQIPRGAAGGGGPERNKSSAASGGATGEDGEDVSAQTQSQREHEAGLQSLVGGGGVWGDLMRRGRGTLRSGTSAEKEGSSSSNVEGLNIASGGGYPVSSAGSRGGLDRGDDIIEPGLTADELEGNADSAPDEGQDDGVLAATTLPLTETTLRSANATALSAQGIAAGAGLSKKRVRPDDLQHVETAWHKSQ